MNRRQFITASAAGTAGMLLWRNNPVSGNVGKLKTKVLPEATILVNENIQNINAVSVLDKRLGELPNDWRILGWTNSPTTFVYNDEVVIADLDVLRLDMKLTGESVDISKIKQIVFVVYNKMNDRQLHMLSANVDVKEAEHWVTNRYLETKGTKKNGWEHKAKYKAVFKPFTTVGSSVKGFFAMTFFSAIGDEYYDENDD